MNLFKKLFEKAESEEVEFRSEKEELEEVILDEVKEETPKEMCQLSFNGNYALRESYKKTEDIDSFSVSGDLNGDLNFSLDNKDYNLKIDTKFSVYYDSSMRQRSWYGHRYLGEEYYIKKFIDKYNSKGDIPYINDKITHALVEEVEKYFMNIKTKEAKELLKELTERKIEVKIDFQVEKSIIDK